MPVLVSTSFKLCAKFTEVFVTMQTEVFVAMQTECSGFNKTHLTENSVFQVCDT